MAAKIEIRTDEGMLDLMQGAATEFYITRQIHDLNNFETRNSDYTKYLPVPVTPNNVKLLHSESGLSNQVRKNAGKIRCSISFNNITIAPIAWIILGGITATREQTVFDIIILYGNFEVFDALKDKSIKDINWADTHTDLTTPADIIGKTAGTYADDDIVFPIADWYTRDSRHWNYTNSDPHKNMFDMSSMGFFIYARNIIDRMLREEGYTLEVAQVTTDTFDKVALACPVEKFIDPILVEEGLALVDGSTSNTAAQAVTGDTEVAVFDNIITTNKIVWNAPNNSFINTVDGGLDQTVDVIVKGTVTHRRGRNFQRSTIKIFQNGIMIARERYRPNYSGPLYLKAVVPMIPGDVFHVEIKGGSGVQDATLTLEAGSTFIIHTHGHLGDNFIRTEDYVPDIKQSSFLANILKMMNLIMVTDTIKRVVTISSFDILFRNAEIDLSSRLQGGSEAVKISYAISSMGQTTYFKWGNDDLYRNDTDASVLFNNTLLEREVTALEMDFSACDISTIITTSLAGVVSRKAKIPMIKAGPIERTYDSIVIDDDGNFTISNTDMDVPEAGDFLEYANEEGQVGIWTRVLTAERVDDTTISGTLDSRVAVSTATSIVYSYKTFSFETSDSRLCVLENIEFEEDIEYRFNGVSPVLLPATAVSALWPNYLKMSEIITNWYGKTLNALSEIQVIRAKFNLSALEVLNMDLRRPVYIDQFNAHYYINKIDQYKVDELTTIELIRISDISNYEDYS